MLGEAMAGRFVKAMFVPETMMEGGILAVLGVTVEGATTFEMSAAAALPAMLILVEAPAMDLSLSTSVVVGSLAMSSLFEVLGTSAAASLPAMCFSGEGPWVLFLTAYFISTAVAFFFRVFAHLVVVVNSARHLPRASFQLV